MEYRTTKEDEARRHETLTIRAELAKTIATLLGDREALEAPNLGLTLIKLTSPTAPTPYQYEPSLAMIIRGRKRVILGDTTYWYDESQFLLTAVNLPTITQVLEASPHDPYMSILWKFDLSAAKQLIAEIDTEEPSTGPAMAVGPATRSLYDALARLIDLLATPSDAPILGDLIQREMLYRVLTSPAGARLRQIVRIGTQSNRVARAVAWLRENYRSPLRVEELARISGMGVSTLHHHFRVLTAMSPLQFQKHLRLHEARRLLLAEEVDAGTAALHVGYESATQFNREYRRLFGAPPIRDVKALRSISAAPTETAAAI
ncbi:AraC family transcriptional regulator N-terminal domain-containing protein [Pseudochelatococcus sp. B33]